MIYSVLLIIKLHLYHFQFYDPGMVEIKMLIVSLPESETPIIFPQIHINLDINDGSNWKLCSDDEVCDTTTHYSVLTATMMEIDCSYLTLDD